MFVGSMDSYVINGKYIVVYSVGFIIDMGYELLRWLYILLENYMVGGFVIVCFNGFV